jgi:transposase
MTHPGVGPITGLAFVMIIGTPERFPCGKQIGSYDHIAVVGRIDVAAL